MESEIQEKTNHTELLMQLYLDIKELKDDWTEIVEEGIDIDNIMRTYKFYVKYIEKIDNGDLSFDDYVLFYIQDRSEYAAKCLLEKIWEEMNILLEIYDSNRKIFNKYDCKGLSNSIIQVPCYFNYNDILISLEKKDPEELDTRFSRFTQSLPTIDYPDDGITKPSANSLLNTLKRYVESQAMELADNIRCFRFKSLSDLISGCHAVNHLFTGESTLYKADDGAFYLFLFRDSESDSFDTLTSVLMEYGDRIMTGIGTPSYFEEHYDLMMDRHVIESLGKI